MTDADKFEVIHQGRKEKKLSIEIDFLDDMAELPCLFQFDTQGEIRAFRLGIQAMATAAGIKQDYEILYTDEES